MISRLFWLVTLSLPLISCSMNNGDDQLTHNNRVIAKQDMRMAGARGVNTEVLDKELSALLNEATDIEKQMMALSDRLKKLKQTISGFDTTVIEHSPVQVKASEKPKTILPVAERPKAEVKTPPKPVVKKTVKKVKSKPAVKTTMSKAKGVVGVRIGVHKDKTRLVFDVNGSTARTHDFDKEAGLLTISLPKTSWATKTQKMYKLSQVSGYDVNKQGQGSVIALAVKNTSSVKTSSIAKTKTKPARLIVDLIK
jgi:hypothetical protein